MLTDTQFDKCTDCSPGWQLVNFFWVFHKLWLEIHCAHVNGDTISLIGKHEASGSENGSWKTNSCVDEDEDDHDGDDEKAFAAMHSTYTTPGGRNSHLTHLQLKQWLKTSSLKKQRQQQQKTITLCTVTDMFSLDNLLLTWTTTHQKKSHCILSYCNTYQWNTINVLLSITESKLTLLSSSWKRSTTSKCTLCLKIGGRGTFWQETQVFAPQRLHNKPSVCQYLFSKSRLNVWGERDTVKGSKFPFVHLLPSLVDTYSSASLIWFCSSVQYGY